MSAQSTLLVALALLLVACAPPETDEPEMPQPPAPEPSAERAPEPAPDPAPDFREVLREAAEGSHRRESDRARNRYRNPVETLGFLGLEEDHTVVEIWPGGGWYTEVLAPALRDAGTLVVANFPEDPAREMTTRIAQALRFKFNENPEVYDQVELVDFSPPQHPNLGEPDSADLVLLSRHFHNLIARDIHDAVLRAAFEVLRPGGVLGVLQHRLPEDREYDPAVRRGYVPESFVIEAAEAAGFTLAERSEINANPLDTADHPGGVWTLPPTLGACRDIEDEAEATACEERYRAIGESDRMTLKFVKPEASVEAEA